MLSLGVELKLALFSILSFAAAVLCSHFFSIFWVLPTAEYIERTPDLALEWQCWLEGLLASSIRWS